MHLEGSSLEHLLHPGSQMAGTVLLPILIPNCLVESLKELQVPVEEQVSQFDGHCMQVPLLR